MRYSESLRIMSMVGQCYKKDFLIATATKGNHQISNLEKLKKEGYVLEREVLLPGSNGKKTIEVMAITKKGRIKCSNLNNTNYYCDVTNYIQDKFSTGVPIDLHKGLLQSRMFLIMHQANIRSFIDEKPSLVNLFKENIARDEQTTLPAPANIKDFYQVNISTSEALQSGVYYSMKEYREFLNEIKKSNSEDDVTFCKARGIYIDNEKTCVVYHGDVFKDKKIKLNVSTESRMINSVLQHFVQLNHVNKVDAMVITNGRAIIVDMGIDGKKGHTPHDSTNQKMDNATQWIQKNITMFKKVYVFPHSVSGIKSLDYFSHSTITKWQDDSFELVNKLNNFTPIPKEQNQSKYLFGRDLATNTRTVFIPFYELKFIEQIRTFHDEVSIITYSEMADTLAHIIRKKNAIYDMSGKRMDTKVYQPNGYVEGTTPPEHKTKPRKIKITQVAFKVTDEEKSMIRRICNQRGIPVSRFLKNLTMPLVKEEYKKYEEYFKLEDEHRKLIEQSKQI